jgi:hypothetical protein
LTTRLLRNALIECPDFRIEHFEGSTARTVLAGCGGLTSRYCLDELSDNDTAIVTTGRMAHTVLGRSRAQKMGGTCR